MRILYMDCSMGAAGDMMTAALLELVENREAFVEKLNNAGIPGVRFASEPSSKCGITGTHMHAYVKGEEEHEHHHEHDHEHEHHHSGMQDILHIVKHLKVSDKIKMSIIGIYELIAEAESTVHGKPVPEIHFHEVGTLDAVADISAVCMLMEEIGADKIIASPVHTGSGHVHCAHGILPVPAPATAHILKGIPAYGGEIQGELCTPTGAALLKYFVDEFGPMPVMVTEKIGYGMGTRDFRRANCLRAMLGESESKTDVIAELVASVDDMTGEEIGFATEALLEAGARDVFVVPAYMKKNRPGQVIHVICGEEDKEKLVRMIFKYTSTIGIRENICVRYVLDRRSEEIETGFGIVRKKISEGYGVKKEKFEYEDLVRIAKENSISIKDVIEEVDHV